MSILESARKAAGKEKKKTNGIDNTSKNKTPTSKSSTYKSSILESARKAAEEEKRQKSSSTISGGTIDKIVKGTAEGVKNATSTTAEYLNRANKYATDTTTAYADAKNKVKNTSTTTNIARKKRIRELQSEIATVNKELSGLSRASIYGDVDDIVKQRQGKLSALSAELNTLKTAEEEENALNKVTITSDLSEKERKARIKEINSEIQNLNYRLRGLSMSASYGTDKDYITKTSNETRKQIDELEKELKSLERVGTYTVAELKQFEIDDAKEEKSKLPNYNSTAWVSSPSEVEAHIKNAQAHSEAERKISALEREKELYENIAKFSDVVNEDNFTGQWRANYRSNELSRQADKAMSEYIRNPTEENRQIAYAYDAFAKEYMKNNAEALDDENVELGWLSKSLAGYLPQFKDQIGPELIGGGIGLAFGSAVGQPTAGASIGAGMGSYAQMYDVMQGSVYRTLIAEGVDEQTALEAAQDEALISSLIEGGGTAISWMLLGGGKALSSIAGAAKSSVAKGSANAATKAVASLATKTAASKATLTAAHPVLTTGLKVAGGVVGNAASEYGEEFTQQGVSIANKDRALNNTDESLITGSAKLIKDAVTGKNPEALAEMHEAGKEGWKIGLMMGGSGATVNNIVTHYANAKTVNQQNEFVDSIIEDEESLTALIEEGKASGEGTVSAKIAEKVEQAKAKGKVTREQVKQLIASNDVYIKNEEQATAIKNSEVAKNTKGANDTNIVQSATPLATRLEEQSKGNEAISIEDAKRASGFGENGAKLLVETASEDGMTFFTARDKMKVAYLSGYAGEDINFTSDLEKKAKLAGIGDRLADNNIAKENVKNATVYKGAFTENEFTKNFTEAERTMISTVAKSLKMDISVVDKIIASTKIVNGKIVEYEANAEHQDGKMRISSTAEKVIYELVMHEGGHRMKQLAPVEFGVLMDALYKRAESLGRVSKLGVTQGLVFDEIKSEHDRAGVDLNTSGYIEEIAVRELETIFSSAEEFNKWYAEISGNQQVKNNFERLIDWILEVIEDIKRAWSQLKMTPEERAKAKKTLAELERIKELYANAYKAAENAATERAKEVQSQKAQKNTDSESDGKRFSLKEIVDEAGKSYGIGVVLDSTLLDNLTPKERVEMVKEYVKELGGNIFTAYDSGGNAVAIKIAESNKHFKNKSGKNVAVNKDLTSYIGKNETKQEAITLIDELVISAKYNNSEPSTHSHGWLDNNGKNKWDYWTTYIQDKNNTIWEARLNIANSTNGEKILYDIFPIKKVGQSVTSDKSSTNKKIPQNPESVKRDYSLKDIGYTKAVKNGDMETAQRMVDEAAKEAGYNTPKLYHGTVGFGFTKFDLSKSDDKTTIFLTNNKKIASTYSGVNGERRISDTYNKSIESLSTEELAKELNRLESANDNYSYYNSKKLNKLKNTVNDGITELKSEIEQKMAEYADKMALKYDPNTAKTHGKLVSLKEKLDGLNYNELASAIYELVRYTEVFADNSSKYENLAADIRLLNKLRLLNKSGNITDDVVVKESFGRNSRQVLSKAEALSELKSLSQKGNYALYAKMEKPLIIDGKGQSWNNIRNWWDGVISDKENLNIHEINTTREIAKFAKENGYDSVVIKNIKDNGGRNYNVGNEETADIYVIFDPNKAKSADPVTYDDKGKVIPLSKRFDLENNDIRYSLKDSDYLKAVENNDMETARSMVDEAAEKAFSNSKVRGNDGKLKMVYHGRVSDFNVFDRSFASIEGDFGKGYYFTSNEYDVDANYANEEGPDLRNKVARMAERLEWEDEYSDLSYEEREEIAKQRLITSEPSTITAYLNMENPVYINPNENGTFLDFEEEYDEEYDEYGEPQGLLIDFVEALNRIASDYAYNDVDFSFLYEYAYDNGGVHASDAVKTIKHRITDELTDDNGDLAVNEVIRLAFEEIGFDGIIDSSVYYKFNRMDGMDSGTTHYIVFNSNQIKSADDVTYDDKGKVIPLSQRFNEENDDIRYSLKIEDAINQSMTMEQAKDMIQRAFVIGEIKEWFDGEYKNGDEWLRGEGADAVAMVVENEWTLQQKFLDKIQGLIDEEYYVADIIEAYEKGTLTGKVKQNVVKRLDTTKPTNAKDTRVFAPKDIQNAQEIYKVALERVTNSNREKVQQARADIIMFAHNRGAAEVLGLTQSELNKKLSTWARYTARAKEVSMRINKDVALFNKWTGIENSNVLNRATVSQAELDNLVNDIKGDSNGWQRSYIMRTMLALDTHIDYSELNFEFVGTPKSTFGKSVNGLYDNSNRKITVKYNAPHTVAHEMGHFLDYQWARDLGCSGALTDGFSRDKQTDADVKQFLTNFDEFIEQIEDVADLRSEYTMDRKEVFARFVAKFVQWVDLVANGKRSYTQEYLSYNDKFTATQYIEFVRLLQEKSMLDSKNFENKSFSLKDTEINSIDDIKTKYADKTDHLYIYEKKNTISIDNMVVKKEYRNQGVGTAILSDVIDYADRVRKTITLTPTSEFGTKERLKKWYKANGFVENKGRKTDFTISDTMYRLPSDVNFSLKNTNHTDTKDRKELLDIIEHLKGEFEVTKFAKADPKKLTKLTKDLLKEYNSKADFDETRSAIDELYTYMANGENGHTAVWEDVYSRAYKVAQNIVENSLVVDDFYYQQYKPLRDYLRGTPIKFDSRHDSVPSSYENFNEFRKMNMGRLKFTNDGMSIDYIYQELATLYPEFFNAEEEFTSESQFEQILNVLDQIQPTEINPFDSQFEQVSMQLANDITSRFFDIPQAKPTFADKAERRVVAERIKSGKKVEAVRQKKDERIKKLLESQRAKTKTQLVKLREQRDAKVKKEQEKRRNAISKMSEKQKVKVFRARILRHTSDLSKKLVNPTDNQHIPYELQGAVAKLLESINLESNYTLDVESGSYKKNDDGLPTKRTQAFNELKKIYSEMSSSVVVDPDLLGENGWLSDVISLADKRIADMNSSELDTIWQAIRSIEASISTANKIFSQGKFATILEYAESLREDNLSKKEKAEFKGVLGKGKNLATLDMLTPETYFHYLGSAGDSMFRMMRDAQDKHISIMKEVADFTHKTLKGVDVNSLEKTMHTVKLGGEEVKLTTAQLMELYVLMRRDQAKEHILIGGILPDITNGKGLKLNTKAEPIRNISMDEISKALSNLTDEQKKIADEMQKYVSTVLSEYGNEASMKVYNYEKFLEKNYWTIRTNKQEVNSEIGKDTTVTSVANKGMAKGTIPHANTSVRIGSIFDTFASHSSDMATYSAWLGTSEDVNRIRNFVFWENGARTGTVKGILDTVHGLKGSDYLQKLLTDVAIGVKGTDNMNPFDKLIGGYKAASVGANLRVLVQQPTAILRAMDMIGAHYLAEGAVKPLNGWKKAKKYAPIAQWKDWGHFDINTGRQMKDVLFDNASLLEKTKQVSMWGASKMDSLAWGQLWNAVEMETRAKHKGLEVGSEEYYQTVAKRFTEIIDHTQVVDGILQRSQIMRSPDALTKMATSFMGEPTKQYNMAVAAAYDAINSKGDVRKKAIARLGRTAVSLAVAGIVNACVQSFIDAMRDDDKEKDYWEKWLASFVGYGEDDKFIDSNLANTINPLTYVPFAKDIVSIMQGYDVKRMDTEAITKTFNAITNMYKAITGTGKYTIAEASAQLFAEASRLYGLPVANVKRDIKSIVMTVATETDSYVMQYRMEKAMLNINFAGNSKNFMDILFNAYNNDTEAYEIIYDDMLKSGYDADKIQSGMETRMKKAEGVEKSSDLSKRYMSPDVEKKYDSSLNKVKASKVWKSANATQRKEVEADLYTYLTSDSEDMVKARAEARLYGVDETEYALWQLAIEMADQPTGQKGSGNYDYAEKAEAINSLNLGDREMAYFFGKGLNETSKEEIEEVLDAGIDMKEYVNFKAATSEMKADKNAKGNSIPNSKKKKVVKYLNNAGLTDEEWEYFYYEIMNYKK